MESGGAGGRRDLEGARLPGAGGGGASPRLGEDSGAFERGQLPPFSRWQAAKRKIADARPNQPQGGVPDGCRHPADLAVFAFREFERKPCVWHIFPNANRRIAGRKHRCGIEKAGPARQGAMTAEVKSAGFESAQSIRSRDMFDLRPILAAVPVPRVQQARVEAGFVAEEEEAFGVRVEPAKRIYFCRQTEICECAPAGAGFGSELREHAVRFVEGDQHAGLSDGCGRREARGNAGRSGAKARP